jgi:large subunit ribosomal protein L21
MYAVVEAAGEQIKVSAGDTVRLEKMSGILNSEIVMDKVLMIYTEGKNIWGKPYVSGASVKAEVVGEGKADKVMVLRSQSKKVHNRTVGHRQHFITLKIKEIIGG